MAEFLATILAFPTVVFTALLALVTLYWLLVVVGALDLDVLDADLDVDGAGEGGLSAALSAAGLGGVPVTIVLSLVVLFAWVLSATGAGVVTRAFGQPGALGGAAVALAALGLAVAATAIVARPLRRLFDAPRALENRRLVGRVCTITTQRVDGRFGQAEIADGGAGLLVPVRCTEPNDLTRGSAALIFDYCDEDGTFQVARLDDGALAEPPRSNIGRSN
jgi:hypothetical protein